MSDCIEFPGVKDRHGYGRMRFQGEMVGAHRVGFFTLYGWWPPVVRHTCDNPPCWNPGHLIPGTHDDNMLDMVRRARQYTSLAEHDVVGVKLMSGAGFLQREIASAFGVHQSQVSRILTGKSRRVS